MFISPLHKSYFPGETPKNVLDCVETEQTVFQFPSIYYKYYYKPRALRRGFAAAHLLGLRLRIQQEACLSVASVVCLGVDATALG